MLGTSTGWFYDSFVVGGVSLPPSISQPKLGDVVAPGPDFDGDKAWPQGRVVAEDSSTRYLKVDWSPSGPSENWNTFTADVCSLVVVACAEVVRASHSIPSGKPLMRTRGPPLAHRYFFTLWHANKYHGGEHDNVISGKYL